VLCVLVAWSAATGDLAFGDPPAAGGNEIGQTSDAQKRKQVIAEIQRLVREVNQLKSAGKLAEAIAAGKKAVGLSRGIDGDASEGVASLEDLLAPIYEGREDWPGARAARQTSLAVRQSLYGDNDWRVTDARLALADVDVHMRLDPKGRRELADADLLANQARALQQMGQPGRGIPLANRALEIRRRLLGPEHSSVPASLNDLGVLYTSLNRQTQAEPFFQQALDIRRKILGNDHPNTAVCLHNLAAVAEAKADLAKAEGLHLEALAIRKKALGEQHALTAQSFDALAALRAKMAAQMMQRADFASARRTQNDLLQQLVGRYGERNWRVTDARLSLKDVDLLEQLSPEDRAQLKVADEQNREWDRLFAEHHFREAIVPIEKVLAIRRKILGKEHRDTARCLNDLGGAYLNLKEYDKLEPLLQEVLTIRMKTLSEEHPDTATTFDKIGKLLELEGNDAKAAAYYRKALGLRIKIYGGHHADTLSSFDSLAATEGKLVARKLTEGKYAEAAKYQDLLTGLLAARYGERDWRPVTARLKRRDIDLEEGLTPEARAQLKEADRRDAARRQLKDQGRFRDALAEAERVVEIRKKIQGEQHPMTAVSLNNAAVLNELLEEHAKAETLYKQAIDINRKVQGDFHPDTAFCLGNLAHLYAAKEEFDKADPLCRRVLEIRLRIDGEKGADTGTAWDQLISLHEAMVGRLLEKSDYASAKKLQSDTLRLLARRYPAQDWHLTNARLKLRDIEFQEKLSPEGRAGLKRIGELIAVRSQLFAQGRYREALIPQEQSLEIRKKFLGEMLPDLATNLNNVAMIYAQLHADAKAEPLYQQALSIRRKVLGEMHPDTAASLENLAVLYDGRGKLEQAEPFYRQALFIRQRLAGEKDNATLATFNKLMALYRRKALQDADSSDYTAARQLRVAAIQLLARRYGERNWQVTDARLKLRDLELRQKLTPEARAELKKADQLDSEHLRLLEQDRYRESLVPALEALEIRKRILGGEHADTVAGLNGVGLLYDRLKDYANAETFYRQALAARKKILGDEHPDTANSLGNLAVVYREKGDDAQAEPLYLQAVEIEMRLLGKRHGLTLATLSELVALQAKMVGRFLAAGDYAAARRIQEELVRVLFEEYGANDRKVVDARSLLADLESRTRLPAMALADLKRAEARVEEGRQFFSQHKYEEAIAPAREAFDIRLRTLGPAHHDTVASFNNLDVVYRAAIGEELDHDNYAAAARIQGGRTRAAAECYGEKDWRAIDARLKQQGFEKIAQLPPDELATLKHRGALEKEFLEQSRAGAYRDALVTAEKGLALVRKIFGDGSLETVSWLNYAGSAHSRLREVAPARSQYEQVLEIARKQLGPAHPQTASAASNVATMCCAGKKFEQALPLYQEALAIRRRVLGETAADTRASYDDVLRVLQAVAQQNFSKGDFATCRRLSDDVLSLERQRYGEKDWHVVNARLRRENVDVQERLSPEARAELKKAEGLLSQAHQVLGKRQYAQAADLARQVFEIRKRLLGEENPGTLTASNDWGVDLRAAGDYAAARPVLERTLAIRRKVLGEDHTDTANSYSSLAEVLATAGDYAAAIHDAEQALAIQRRIFGEEHAEVASCWITLGDLFLSTGECTAARGDFERALVINRKLKGEDALETAAVYSRLGRTFHMLADYPAARRNVERALAIKLKVQREDDLDTATLYCSLGALDSDSGDYNSARAHYERALTASRKLGGDDCLAAANAYDGLGMVLWGLHDYRRAREYKERTLAIDRKILGEEHTSTAMAYSRLGIALRDLGEYAEARKNLEMALAIDRKVLGEDHQATALLHNNLGMLGLDQGDFTAAFAEEEQALAITQGFLARMFGSLSEDQQLALQEDVRFNLDSYLTLAGRVHADDAAVYAWVLKSKGAVTAEQFLIHLQRRKSGVAKLFDELQATSTRLSALDGELSQLSVSVSDPKQREKRLQQIQKEIRQLNARNESLQQQLVAKNSDFRQAKESAQLRPADIQKVLPPKSALVDFVEYWHYPQKAPGQHERAIERRLLAFVIRPDQPIHRIELGSADVVAGQIDAWNREVVGSRGSDGATFRDELGNLIWKPVEPLLKDVDTVVVSPDGSLCQFPFAVLPGSKPGSYLIEDRKLAVIPVPRLLPQLLAQSYSAADENVSESPLLIGNVDYEGDPGAILVAKNDILDRSRSREPEGNRAGERLEFKYLPGTKEEMEAIDQLYRQKFPGHEPHVLAGLDATEQAFRDKAPKHRWVHLATHGYFIPQPATDRTKPVEDLLGAKQEMHSSHPGLWSGIALSGANGRLETNHSPAQATEGKPPRDDGKLTALEVEGLDLMDVDLIVLSACQTALGRLTRGEGMLGLQRAFQLAGAKTAVTSLWTVDDTATRVLMTEFYKNLWEKKLPKLEALRQAQLSMLHDYDPSQMKLTSRGLDLDEGETESHKTGARTRGSPYYWAAFVLSGDWR
jgi:CHAT domain-containing protein